MSVVMMLTAAVVALMMPSENHGRASGLMWLLGARVVAILALLIAGLVLAEGWP